MDNQHSQAPDIDSYIASHRQAGTTDEQITIQLLQNGWTLEQVQKALNKDVPAAPSPVTNNFSAQTGNTGTPIQVENVQYNMKMKPVESKVGLYIKVASVGLWFTVLFVASFLSTLVQKIAGNGGDVANELVLTLSLSVVAIPIFLIAYKKFRAELVKNPVTNDDIFFKKIVRLNLWWGIIWGALASVITVYQLLAAAFLRNSSGSYAAAFSALMYALGFGVIIMFYWRLHAKTQR